MRAIAALIGLLLVLAVVGGLLRTQLKASPSLQSPTLSTAASLPAAGTPATAARRVEKQVSDDVGRALEQGARRNDEAEAAR